MSVHGPRSLQCGCIPLRPHQPRLAASSSLLLPMHHVRWPRHCPALGPQPPWPPPQHRRLQITRHAGCCSDGAPPRAAPHPLCLRCLQLRRRAGAGPATCCRARPPPALLPQGHPPPGLLRQHPLQLLAPRPHLPHPHTRLLAGVLPPGGASVSGQWVMQWGGSLFVARRFCGKGGPPS
jgi:hypothetical protein